MKLKLIADRLFIPMIVFFVVLSLISGIFISNQLSSNLLKAGLIRLEKDTTIISEEINTYFNSGEVLVRQMLTNVDFLEYIHATDSFSKKRSFYRYKEVVQMLQNIKASSPLVLNTWLGTEGMDDLLTDDPNYDGGEDYDLSERPWFINMVKENGVVTFTDPYVDWITRKTVVSLASPIITDENFIVGALGIDLAVDHINEYIQSYDTGYNASTLLISNKGEFLVNGETSRFPVLIDETDLEGVMPRLLAEDYGVLGFENDGTSYYLAFGKVEVSDWKVILLVPKKELLKNEFFINFLQLNSYIAFAAIIMLLVILAKIRKFSEDILQQKEYIRHLAEEDPLTGIPNRRIFLERLKESIDQNCSGIVMLIDLDNFKGINDVMGHVYGDTILTFVAKILNQQKDEHTFVSRFGGDEFLILIEEKNVNNRVDLLTKVEDRINHFEEVINQRYEIDEDKLYIQGSLGIAMYPYDSKTVGDLITFADMAMYASKKKKQHKYTFFTNDMASELSEKNQIERVLRNALEENGFELVYQPIVNAKSGYISCFEALLRLKNRTYGPDKIIPVAEETGLIIPIGRWVVEESIKLIAHWKAKGLPKKQIAINLSVRQLADREFVSYVEDLLTLYHVDGSYLEIEVTESVFLDNTLSSRYFFSNLAKLGMGISLDDFGAGYSALSYLRHIPFTKIKIDKELIAKDSENMMEGLVEGIIELFHRIGMIVVAEGVEDEVQLRHLIQRDCDQIQGYLFSMPLRREEAEVIYLQQFNLL